MSGTTTNQRLKDWVADGTMTPFGGDDGSGAAGGVAH